MGKNYLDDNGVLYLWSKIKSIFVAKEEGKGLSSNDYTTEEKNKLAGIATGANKTVVDSSLSSTSTNPVQNKVIAAKFDNYLPLTGGTLTGELTGTTFVGSLTGNASSASKLETSRNINGLSFNGTADRVNYASCSTAASTAAKTVDCTGFALVTGAEITVKFTVNNTASSPTLNVNGTGAKAIYYRGAAITAGYLAANRTYTFRYNGTQYDLVGDIDTNTTYSAATTSADGLMSAADKTKLDGIATGANKTTVDSELSSTSTNPVQNKVINTALASKISTSTKGQPNGVATLGSDGLIPSSQLPSYVDDVVEGYYYNSKFYKESEHTTEITGETGKIYVDLSTNNSYRYGGSTFVLITSSDMVAITNSEIDSICV